MRQLIPHARVARLDSDTTTDRKKYLAILQKVRNHDVDILVGTQMVAKARGQMSVSIVPMGEKHNIWAL